MHSGGEASAEGRRGSSNHGLPPSFIDWTDVVATLWCLARERLAAIGLRPSGESWNEKLHAGRNSAFDARVSEGRDEACFSPGDLMAPSSALYIRVRPPAMDILPAVADEASGRGMEAVPAGNRDERRLARQRFIFRQAVGQGQQFLDVLVPTEIARA